MVRKGEIARDEQFLLFHSVFYPFGELSAIFIKFKIIVGNSFSLENKNLLFGKGLTRRKTMLKMTRNTGDKHFLHFPKVFQSFH